MPPVLLELLYINSIYIPIIAILTYSAYRRKNNMISFWIINIIYIFILGVLIVDSLQPYEPGSGAGWADMYSIILQGILTGITILVYIFLNWKIVKRIFLP